jgi:DNA-binding GntR family transcriptional regulator
MLGEAAQNACRQLTAATEGRGDREHRHLIRAFAEHDFEAASILMGALNAFSCAWPN